ncbi:hypothetical protein ARAM_002665 [Aspergillus rambellii]|uniref:BZIP domain-containing protein n=1 Tax=Aspergillus rambellii TaxID=308745 RepID=A0A0F8WGK3_9EURO|nr:hypothetical protein ARAM_002665 [Aspergillus rambellii]
MLPPQYQQRAPRARPPQPSTCSEDKSSQYQHHFSPDSFLSDVDFLTSSSFSSSSSTPHLFPDLPAAFPPADTTPLFYNPLQPQPQPCFFSGPAASNFIDITLQPCMGFPDLLDSTTTGIDWTALDCLSGSSELNGTPNVFESASPDPPPPGPQQQHQPAPDATKSTTSAWSTKKTVSMPSGATPTSLSTPSPASRESSPKHTAAASRVSKRQLNTLAARRYRQRRIDRMNQLEAELEAVKRERDELKMRVSKLEGETDALRSMVQEKSR